MQVIKQTAPYIRKETSTKRMMTDVLIALIPVVLFSIYKYGVNALLRILVSLVLIVGVEVLWVLYLEKKTGNKDHVGKRLTINNITAPAITAIIYAMLLPDQLPLYVTAVGALFAIVVAKLIFGGLGNNIFNPAATGRIFIAVALGYFFTEAYSQIDAVAGATALSSSMPFNELIATYSLKDLFLGDVPGAMGEISALAILIGAAYLIVRKAADYRVMASAVITFVVLTLIVGLVLKDADGNLLYGDHLLEFVLFQVLSGGLLFNVVFMITDPVTSPVTRTGRVIFGGFIAFLVVLIRHFGGYPEGVAFALLIGNAIVPLLDHAKWASNTIGKKQVIAIALLFLSAMLITLLGGIL